MAGRLILNPGEITALLRSEHGPVGTDLTRRVLRVHAAARRLCPVDMGRLRSSIRWSIRQDSRGLVGLVGSDVNYALYVHEGTRPHWAPPGALNVWARRHGFPAKGGDFLVRRAIAVKGTKGRPFLLNALKEAG